MKVRKVVLVILFLFSLFSLIIIIYSAKNKVSFFKYFENQHLERLTDSFNKVITNNINQVFVEVKALSEDNMLKSVFVSASVGENTSRYLEDFTKIKNGIGGCEKVQALDAEGKIIFSTVAEEINAQKFRANYMESMRAFFSNQNPVYLYCINNGQFVSIAELSSETIKGYVAVYYHMEKLLKGLSTNKVVIPLSFGNDIFFSSSAVDKGEVNKIINYYNQPENKNKKFVGTSIGRYMEFKGLKMYYYPKEKYISIITIFILLLNFLLLGTVVYALVQVQREEKMYRSVDLSSLEKGLPDYASSAGSSVRDLAGDIETNERFDSDYTKKGIEDMILSNDMDLTQMPELKHEEPPLHEPLEWSTIKEEDLGISPIDQELHVPELQPIEEIKPSPVTEMFAEQDRILDGVDNQKFNDVIVPLEETPQDVVVETAIPDFPAMEAPEADLAVEQKDFATEDDLSIFVGDDAGELPPDAGVLEEKGLIEPIAEEKKSLEEFPYEMETKLPDIQQTDFTDIDEAPVLMMDHAELSEIPSDSPAAQDVFSNPPARVSSIFTVADYGNAAIDVAKKSLNINKVLVLEKKDNRYDTIINNGFETSQLSLEANDPLVELFLSKHKSVDIKGDLKSTRYLQERFPSGLLENLDEMLVVPVIKQSEVHGIALFAREKGIPEPGNFQKLELYNLGFLQET